MVARSRSKTFLYGSQHEQTIRLIYRTNIIEILTFQNPVSRTIDKNEVPEQILQVVKFCSERGNEKDIEIVRVDCRCVYKRSDLL